MNVAQIILSQIKAIDPMALFAWGAKNIWADTDGLGFTSSGMTRWKGNVFVKYNEGTDLYDITFARIRKMEQIIDKRVNDVFCEDLVRVIDEQVG